MKLVIDSNVLVDAFLPPEYIDPEKKKRSEKAKRLWHACLSGKHAVAIPGVALIEVCAVLSRVSENEKFAVEATRKIEKNTYVIYQDEEFCKQIERIARIDYKGIDAIFSLIAYLLQAILITSDRNLYEYLYNNHDKLNIDVRFLPEMSEEEIN